MCFEPPETSFCCAFLVFAWPPGEQQRHNECELATISRSPAKAYALPLERHLKRLVAGAPDKTNISTKKTH